jgi:hypothetical protein
MDLSRGLGDVYKRQVYTVIPILVDFSLPEAVHNASINKATRKHKQLI